MGTLYFCTILFIDFLKAGTLKTLKSFQSPRFTNYLRYTFFKISSLSHPEFRYVSSLSGPWGLVLVVLLCWQSLQNGLFKPHSKCSTLKRKKASFYGQICYNWPCGWTQPRHDNGFQQVQETCEGINFDQEEREQDHVQRRVQQLPKHFQPASCVTNFCNISNIQEASSRPDEEQFQYSSL